MKKIVLRFEQHNDLLYINIMLLSSMHDLAKLNYSFFLAIKYSWTMFMAHVGSQNQKQGSLTRCKVQKTKKQILPIL